jgi:glycerol uptake facilitator-like aquaporin
LYIPITVYTFSASAVIYLAFAGPLRAFEAENHIIRGQPGSEASAMIFGEFFPNPGWQHPAVANAVAVPEGAAFLVEAIGTAVLVLVILYCVSPIHEIARIRGP